MARYILWLAFATGAVVRAVAESEGSVSPLVLWSRSNPAAFGDERSLSSLDTVARLTSWIDSRLEGPRAPELVIVLRGGSGSGVQSGLQECPQLHREITGSTSFVTIPFAPAISWDRWGGEYLASSSWPTAHEFVAARTATAKRPGSPAVVVLDDFTAQEMDAQFSALLAKAEEATGGNFAVALAMEPIEQAPIEYIEAMTSPARRRLSTTSSSDAIAYIHMTPDLLAGILTGLLLVMIAMIGLTCLSSIQTPSQFTDKPPPSSREY
jgi:hypothetical protein